MRMTNLLEPIAYEVITSMSQLFDYYLYTVYTRFAAQHMVSTMDLHNIMYS